MNLPELLNNRKEIRIQPVAERAASVIAYRRVLMSLLRDIRRFANETILPLYKSELTTDNEGWLDLLREIAIGASSIAVEKTGAIFYGELVSHTERTVKNVYTSTGIDISSVFIISEEDERRIVELYIQRNASLIKSLSDDAVKRVEQAVYEARLERYTYHQLSEKLVKEFGILKNRADLISYDQLASLNSDFTKSRHSALGISKYRWRTRHDKKVRPLHRSLNGELFEWDKPTRAEGGLPPGKPIRCRCTAVAVIPAANERRNEAREDAIAESNVEAVEQIKEQMRETRRRNRSSGN